MTFDEALEKIYSLLRFGSKPGLDRLRVLLDKLGNPHKDMNFVHVAGTNGKGSTSTMISSVLRCSGYKTGLYISPYVLEFCERIQINNSLIPKDELSRLVEETFPIVEHLRAEGVIITEFEYLTSLAFLYFKRQKCDIVVLEVGLGGRFDATNVIEKPLISVITSISLDHTSILGDTPEKIAFEKAGIIKKNCPLVYRRQEKAVNDVFEEKARELKSKIIYADELDIAPIHTSNFENRFSYNENEYSLKLLGPHQLKNASLAIGALEELRKQGYSITSESLKKGLSEAFIPARFEVISKSPAIILDGAHNPDGMLGLGNALSNVLNGKKAICLIGMLADKNIDKSLSYIEPFFDTVICTSPDSPRAMSTDEFSQLASKHFANVVSIDDNKEALETAINMLNSRDTLVVCGSLYLASTLRPWLKNMDQI